MGFIETGIKKMDFFMYCIGYRLCTMVVNIVKSIKLCSQWLLDSSN